MGAESWGIDFRPWDRFLKETTIMAEFKPVGPNLDSSLQWFVSVYGGAKYDYGAVGATVIKYRLKLMWKWLGRWLRSKLTSPKKLMCSEVLIRILAHGKYEAVKTLDPETTDAQKLMAAYFEARKEFKLISAHQSIQKVI